jgi:hypothetical protein
MNSLLITYLGDDLEVESSVIVKRVNRSRYNDFKILLQHLLEGFLYHNGCIGEIHEDPKYRASALKLLAMLPVVGSPEEKVDAERLLEDYDQCRSLLYTTAPFIEEIGEYDPEVIINFGWSASKLAVLHGIDYTKVVREANQAVQKMIQLPQIPMLETETVTAPTKNTRARK